MGRELGAECGRVVPLLPSWHGVESGKVAKGWALLSWWPRQPWRAAQGAPAGFWVGHQCPERSTQPSPWGSRPPPRISLAALGVWHQHLPVEVSVAGAEGWVFKHLEAALKARPAVGGWVPGSHPMWEGSPQCGTVESGGWLQVQILPQFLHGCLGGWSPSVPAACPSCPHPTPHSCRWPSLQPRLGPLSCGRVTPWPAPASGAPAPTGASFTYFFPNRPSPTSSQLLGFTLARAAGLGHPFTRHPCH